MSHPNHSVTLVQTTFGDLVQVQNLDDLLVSGSGAPLGLRKGEVIQCLDNNGHGVLIARADGSRVLVPNGNACKVGIRRFPDWPQADGLPDGIAPEQGFHAHPHPGEL